MMTHCRWHTLRSRHTSPFRPAAMDQYMSGHSFPLSSYCSDRRDTLEECLTREHPKPVQPFRSDTSSEDSKAASATCDNVLLILRHRFFSGLRTGPCENVADPYIYSSGNSSYRTNSSLPVWHTLNFRPSGSRQSVCRY